MLERFAVIHQVKFAWSAEIRPKIFRPFYGQKFPPTHFRQVFVDENEMFQLPRLDERKARMVDERTLFTGTKYQNIGK